MYVFIKATLKFVDSKIVLSKINYINLSKGFIELN